MHNFQRTLFATLFAASIAIPATAIAGMNNLSQGLGHQSQQTGLSSSMNGTTSQDMSPKRSKSADMQAIPKPLPPKAVKTVQNALDHKGAHLKVNGRMDLKTIEALMSFQVKEHIKPTGFVNTQTAHKLAITNALKREGANLS